MDFGVIDVNFLAHLPTIKGQLVSAVASHTMRGKLTHAMRSLIRVGTENWRRSSLCTFGIPSSGQFQRHDLDPESFGAESSSAPRSSLSTASNVVLFGTGAGCSALVEMVQKRGGEKRPSRVVPLSIRAAILKFIEFSNGCSTSQGLRFSARTRAPSGTRQFLRLSNLVQTGEPVLFAASRCRRALMQLCVPSRTRLCFCRRTIRCKTTRGKQARTRKSLAIFFERVRLRLVPLL